MLVLALLLSTSTWASCIVAKPGECPAGKVCAKYDNDSHTACFDIPKKATIIFELPFDNKTPVVCTQSGRLDPKASHTWLNMIYALDLATPTKHAAGIVRASAPGKAYVVSGCKTHPGPVDNVPTDGCGQGYGNHVRILHEGGYLSIYAHLGDVSVKTGDQVKTGQKIGMESSTGLAGFRHLHWDVHKLEMPSEHWDTFLRNPAAGANSVPFDFNVIVKGQRKTLNSAEVVCPWMDRTGPEWTGTY